jgi:hypothetical protein
MPTTLPTQERQARAQHARRRRTLRIAQLRRQVLAGALATFALAFALVAFDGSMGSSTKAAATSGSGASSSSPAPAPAPAATDQFDDGSAQQFDDGSAEQLDDGSGVAGSSADPVQTGQS